MPPRRFKKPISYNLDKIDPNFLWHVQLGDGIQILVSLSTYVETEGFGPSIILQMKNPTDRIPLTIDVTNLNDSEIGMFREIMNNMFDAASEISIGRDKKAEELTHDGAGTFKRLYRPIPQMVTGPGARDFDSTRLLERPVDAPEPEPNETGLPF